MSIQDLPHEFRRHKDLADRAIVELPDELFFHAPGAAVNSIGLVVKHMAGNLTSRWTDFLTTDGEKPNRDRDNEFVILEGDTREALLAAWDRGWTTVLDAVAELGEEDASKTVTIRGEPHTVFQALIRGLTHAAYHVGQIMYISRLLRPDGQWITIEPGTSSGQLGTYRK